MLIAGFPAAFAGTNCFVAATGPGSECVVIDPGVDVGADLDALISQHHLKPVAVLITHGHFDHTFSVFPVCGARGIPAYIHGADRELLTDPFKGLPANMVGGFGALTFTEPDDVEVVADGAELSVAGLAIAVDHAPGHTAGSVMFRIAGAEPVLFSGDVLFAGSIGRTDLYGGSPSAMATSLATKCLPLPDQTVVYPGHGPQTTIGVERASNPYLRRILAGEPIG